MSCCIKQALQGTLRPVRCAADPEASHREMLQLTDRSAAIVCQSSGGKRFWVAPYYSSLSEHGQATVEAAFLLPMLFFLMALLLQPALLLYDRCVMAAAASETSRLAATTICGDESLEQFAKRRLAAVPQVEIFHSRSCGWTCAIEANADSGESTVVIEGHAKALPLLGLVAKLSGMTAGDGCLSLRAQTSCALMPDWARKTSGGPADWISRWQ